MRSQPPAWQWKWKQSHALRWIASRGDSQTTHASIITDSMSLLQKVKSGMGSPDCQCSTSTFDHPPYWLPSDNIPFSLTHNENKSMKSTVHKFNTVFNNKVRQIWTCKKARQKNKAEAHEMISVTEDLARSISWLPSDNLGSRSSRMRSDTLCVLTYFSLHDVTVKCST